MARSQCDDSGSTELLEQLIDSVFEECVAACGRPIYEVWTRQEPLQCKALANVRMIAANHANVAFDEESLAKDAPPEAFEMADRKINITGLHQQSAFVRAGRDCLERNARSFDSDSRKQLGQEHELSYIAKVNPKMVLCGQRIERSRLIESVLNVREDFCYRSRKPLSHLRRDHAARTTREKLIANDLS